MRVVICGLGYVGAVTAACLLADGHEIVCVDVDARVRDRLAHGLSPVAEPGLGPMLEAGHRAGRLTVAPDLAAVATANVAMVCVGTLPHQDGTLDLGHLLAAARSIGEAVANRDAGAAPLLIVVRSTILPGTMARQFVPAVEAAARQAAGGRYRVAYNPEFMREGSAVADFRAPSRIVVGTAAGGADALFELYRGIDAPRFETSFEIAEAIKFADNGFHALKVAFANEIGRFAAGHGIDAAELLALFRSDTKLNLSEKYLAPGLGFGGPCLPKDVRALATDMQRLGIDAPVMAHVIESNDRHEDFLVARIAAQVSPGARLLLLGLTFKAASGDLRGSPLVSLAERLLAAGYDLHVHDPEMMPGQELPASLGDRTVDDPAAGAWDLVIFGKRLQGSVTLPPNVPSLDLSRF